MSDPHAIRSSPLLRLSKTAKEQWSANSSIPTLGFVDPQDHYNSHHHIQQHILGVTDEDYNQDFDKGSITSFEAVSLCIVWTCDNKSLNDDLIAGVDHPVQSTVAHAGIVEKTQPVGSDDQAEDPVAHFVS